MQLDFTATTFEWRGPAPFVFVAVPEPEAGMIASAAQMVTYGWGMVPVTATIGDTQWTTSLGPRNGGYVVPLKVVVQRAERIELDADICISIVVAV